MSKRVAAALAANCYLLLILCAGAQDLAAQSSRIAAAVDRRETVALAGHLHPLATAANDRGRVDASMPMPGMTLFFRPSASQQQALEALLARQQDPSSPDYHNWLTPEQYADRFGLSPADMAKVRTWLEGEGFSIALTARGRNSITFNGTAGQVEKTFQTQIHHYFVDGRMHYANSTDPSIPAALGGIVGSIRGLHDFHPQAHPNLRKPRFTNTPAQGGGYQIAPDDAAVIYDYKPLYGQSIDGTGQKIAVVGQVQINLTDIATFRSDFNLPASAPTLVPVPNLPAAPSGASDSGDLGESDLDIETVGGVARGANVIFVYSNDVEDAISYAIDQNLAPVLSSSYGQCEVLSAEPPYYGQTGKSYFQTDQMLAQQANAEGITWLAASGDNGGDDCYGQQGDPRAPAVDEPGSIPEVTSVGGTEFNEGTGNYWASTNSANGASALGYILETAWNDSVQDRTPSAGGGGASLYFPRPSWQTGTGSFSTDGMRDVPDVSFSSSADHDGWLIYTGGALYVYGGTSIAAPLFAGMLTLLNHYQVANGYQKTPGLGNVNPKLYSLAASSPGAFHDVTTGNNDVCTGRSQACTNPIGYPAGVGYDMATGLGSLDVFSFITAWNGNKAIPTISVSATPQTVSLSGSTTLTVTVSGSTTPTGSVSWTVGNVTLGTAPLSDSGGRATASLTVQASALSPGANTITATYGGDSTFSSGSQTLTVNVKQTPTISVSPTQSTILASGSTTLTATVSGSTTPTGFVTWTAGSANLGSATLSGSSGKATASLTVYGYQLSAGANTITALYVGDSNFNSGSQTQTVTVTTSQTPNITSNAAVVSSASFQAGVTSNSWVTITGTNLSTVTDTWSNSIVNGALPTTLDGVSVTIGGIPAYIYYVSSTQINVLAPSVGTGSVQVVVTTVNGASAPVTVTAQPLQPGLFLLLPSTYAVATHLNFSVAASGNTVAGATPAKPGETIILWGTGFGATSPAAPAGFVTPSDTIYYTASPVTVTLGTITVSGTAALTPGAAGLYQVAFQVPASMANGDYPVVATINGSQSPATTLLTIQN